MKPLPKPKTVRLQAVPVKARAKRTRVVSLGGDNLKVYNNGGVLSR